LTAIQAIQKDNHQEQDNLHSRILEKMNGQQLCDWLYANGVSNIEWDVCQCPGPDFVRCEGPRPWNLCGFAFAARNYLIESDMQLPMQWSRLVEDISGPEVWLRAAAFCISAQRRVK
jgi:hypothetical protein